MKFRANFRPAKVFLYLTLLLVSFSKMRAQDVEKHLVYYSNEMIFGNNIGFMGDVNYIYQEKYSAKVGLSINFQKSPTQPKDYMSGIEYFLTLGLDSREVAITTYLSAGRIFHLNPAKSLRLNAAVGVGFTQMELRSNYQPAPPQLFTKNYTYDSRSKGAVSLIINPKLEIPLGRVVGISFSPIAIINSERGYYGLGIGYLLGRVRSEKSTN